MSIPKRAVLRSSALLPPIRASAVPRALPVVSQRFNSTTTASSSSSSSSSPTPSSGGKFVPPAPPKGHKSGSTPRVGTTFLLLTAAGIAATSYGLYRYFTAFETWPPQLRDDLRAAVKLRQSGDVKKAEKRFRTALATAQTLSPELLAPSPLLKVTGISIALASMLEEAGQLDKAYTAYKEAFESCFTSEGSVVGRPGVERARAVAISQKLGEVALQIAVVGPERSSGSDLMGTAAERALHALPLGDADADEIGPPPPLPTKRAAREAAETHLVWSVEELLRLSVPQDVQQAAAVTSAASRPGSEPLSKEASQNDSVSLAELDLPPWVSQTDLLGSIESLGSFYAREGRTEYAVPLYLQALEILIPTSSAKARKPQEKITVSDRCRAAVVMNDLSQLFLEGDKPDDEEFAKATAAAGGKEKQALQWAKKGLALVQSTNAKVGWGLIQNQNQGQGQGQSGTGEGTVAPAVGKAKEVVGTEQEARTEEVRRECIRAEVTLLVNLGSLSQLAKDDCAARNYLQRAYRLADQEGLREARNRAASMLAGLERFKAKGKAT